MCLVVLIKAGVCAGCQQSVPELFEYVAGVISAFGVQLEGVLQGLLPQGVIGVGGAKRVDGGLQGGGVRAREGLE